MPEKAQVIRRRIASVSNTAKITRTMEMVATSKLVRAQSKVVGAGPYMETLRGIMSRLALMDLDTSAYPLFEEREVKRVLLMIMTSDRGLCGAYNTNLFRLGREVYERELAAGHEVKLWVVGRKGTDALRFRGIPFDRSIVDSTDKPGFEDARTMANEILEPFLSGEVDRVLIVWPQFITLGRQPPTELQLAPIPKPDAEDSPEDRDFIFEPDPETILGQLLPTYIQNMVYRVLAEAVAAELIARRTAMKIATDNAEEMVKTLTLQANKARQAQITQELSEILGGSEALK
jgi:F-type H+-transporting ATPase subunit gamma